MINSSTFSGVLPSRDATSIALFILLVKEPVFATQFAFHPSQAKDTVLRQKTTELNNNLSFIMDS